MEAIKKQCGEFPHFGASYPDATCINGYLWDLDSEDNGSLTSGGDHPCPFCNTDKHTQIMRDDEIPESDIQGHLKFINERYNS